MSDKLYLAYGANTNHDEMEWRCPDAVFQGTTILENYALVFRGPCDVIAMPDSSVECAVWTVSQRDESRLDIFEDYPRLYKKSTVSLGESQAFFYVMDSQRPFEPPSREYLDGVMHGYEQSNIDLVQIFSALQLTRRLMRNK